MTNHDSPVDAILAAKLLPPGFAVEEIKRRVKNKELTPEDLQTIAERLAENQKWDTLDKMTKQGLLPSNGIAKLRFTYSKTGRLTYQLFDEVFYNDLRNKKIDPQAIRLIKVAVSYVRLGSKESALLYFLRVVEGILTDLCLMCVKKLEQHQDELKNTYNIEVNEHAVNSEWGMFAKSIALNRIGVLDNVEYKALYQDLVLPRNALFHSYVTSLTERDMDDLIRLIWSLLHSLANQITHESEESQEHNANHRSSWFPWTKIQDIFSKLKHIRD